eukprot:TRINITY_DN93431_c0_g1_i1.p1 TRINITY_DN93431_c0_g1~~TRINITY_DN93431_c0_g1_i1.p1  ORF type:complete len:699 (-),score=214.72 TRINITY_DN93431_c0_g1_i1:115-2211(-)
MAIKKGALVLLATSSGAAALSSDALEGKARPITKVVNLLKEMQSKVEAENDKDAQLKEKMDCFCKQGSEEKEKAVAMNKEKIQLLTSILTESKAKVEQLGPQIENNKKALAAAKATVEKANAIREKQVKTFEENRDELEKSISGVKEALQTLKGTALVELSKMPTGRLSTISENLQHVLDTQDVRLSKTLNRADRDQLEQWIKDPKGLVRGTAFLQRGAADSIVGILDAMNDDFSADLKEEVDENRKNKKDYDDTVVAKNDEIIATTSAINKKTEELARNEKTVVDSAADLKLTQTILAEDEKFVVLLTTKCGTADEDYAGRVKARQEELEVLGKTMEVLTSDEARDLQASALSFIQKSSSEGKQRREAIASILSKAGEKLGASALVTLGLEAKINSFTKLKKSIDEMVTNLKKQQKDEVAQFDMCNQDLNKNSLATDGKTNQQTTLEARIGELKASVKTLDADIKQATEEIAELNKQMAAASETRQKEAQEFQDDIKEQKQTQALLQKAMAVLKKFYGTVSGESVESFLQISRSHKSKLKDDSNQPDADALGAPEEMKPYEKNSGGLAVSSLLGHIIEDSKKIEYKLTQSEQDSQERYEGFAMSTAASVKTNTVELESAKKNRAEDMEDLAESKSNLISTMDELQQLGETKLDLHKECDFTIANFEVRQKARQEEMDSLTKAKGILGGADFQAFLQK